MQVLLLTVFEGFEKLEKPQGGGGGGYSAKATRVSWEPKAQVTANKERTSESHTSYVLVRYLLRDQYWRDRQFNLAENVVKSYNRQGDWHKKAKAT